MSSYSNSVMFNESIYTLFIPQIQINTTTGVRTIMQIKWSDIGTVKTYITLHHACINSDLNVFSWTILYAETLSEL